MQTVTRKSPGGKLLRLKAGVVDGKLAAPQLSGDFFLMPPEKIGAIEDALDGFAVKDADDLAETLSYVIERDNIRIQGMKVDDIVAAVKEFSHD